MSESKWDRRTFLPKPRFDDNVLPCNPLFTRLLALAHSTHTSSMIEDIHAGIRKTSIELLSDVTNFRAVLRSRLTARTIAQLDAEEEVYISLLASGGYEFTVGILAILGLGAAASPLSPHQPVGEASYYVNKAESVAVVVASSVLQLGQDLTAEIRQTTNPEFICVSVEDGLEEELRPPSSLRVSSYGYRDLNSPGIVIFSSGTTGPPKGVVLPLAAITDSALSYADQLRISKSDRLLHPLPVHHATGIWVSFFPFLLSGACIEFCSGGFDPEWTWNRWRDGGLTHFSGVPTIYMRMMRYYNDRLCKLSPLQREKYEAAPGKFKAFLCGTSALPRPIDDFWTRMLSGPGPSGHSKQSQRRIIQRYGSTEQGVVFNMPFEYDPNIPDGSVGAVSMGVEVKLSDGDEGEVLTRSFSMFSKYLHDPEATRLAHDGEGFFKSGDIARREGKNYFIVGRASVDIIKSGGYKISALDVEREILSLPYIGEVMVVGVPDDEFGQRVAAAVCLSTENDAARKFLSDRGRLSARDLRLDDLRKDLRSQLAGYKLPTLLRVIREGELPKSATNKVVKKVLGPQYFPFTYRQEPDVQIWPSQKTRPAVKL